MIAETVIGRGDRAFALWKKIAPAYREEISEVHRLEPYVYAQMIAGKDAVRHGEAKNSWLTGTAAWNFVAISQHILGVRPELDGLRVNPCIGAEVPSFTVVRKCRGAEYRITVTNRATGKAGEAGRGRPGDRGDARAVRKARVGGRDRLRGVAPWPARPKPREYRSSCSTGPSS